jgi:outer membrane lipoprotein carrier protein
MEKIMKRIGLIMGVFVLAFGTLPAFGEEVDITRLLKNVEGRYNKAATLQMNFSETYTFQNRQRPAEWGQLYLKKPGKMRWVYQKPAGKLFVSDSKDVYYYSPTANRVEKLKMKEAEDMRAPLAFLLGKLDFNRDFGKFSVRQDGSATWVTCVPKSNKAPYTEVMFKTYEDGRIERLKVVGQDYSILEFEFAGEKLNTPLQDGFFLFQIPPGAEFVDLTAAPPKPAD